VKRIITLFIGSCLLFVASTCVAQMYTVLDLGTLNPSGTVVGINASGQVVGNNYSVGAFRTAANMPINTDTDFLQCHCWVYGINDSGRVVGMFWNPDDWFEAFSTAPNGLDPIIIGESGTFATAINASGEAVIEKYMGYYLQGFRTEPNGYMGDDLGTLTPEGQWAETYGEAVNSAGQVVGIAAVDGYWNLQAHRHAFRTAPNSPINPSTDDLGTLGGSESGANDINAFGQVVGWSYTSGSAAVHAFRTSPNAPINLASDLGTLGGSFSTASSINNFGQVVGGAALSGDTIQHAFLFDGGAMHDLSTLISGGSNCVVLGAVDISRNPPYINDAGQIAANAQCGGELHAVRLDPVYKASVQQPINADGTSVFSAKRGVIPVKFVLTQFGTQPSCTSSATIGIVKASNGTLAAVDESTYSMSADSGSNFRIDSTACQYTYNLAASALGTGTYRVDISINGIMVGHAVFALK